MNPIEAGKEALEAIVLPLQEEKRRLAERIDEIDLTLKPLEAAINPLAGRPRGKKKPKPARTVNQEDVRGVVTRLLSGRGVVDEGSLLAAAKKELKETHGLDLKGFSNRCREVLAGGAFETDEAGQVRLVAATEEPGVERAPRVEAGLRRREPESAVDNSAPSRIGR